MIAYDDHELVGLFESLSGKERAAVIRRAFRYAARYVRNVAVNNLRGAVRSNRRLEKGVRIEMLRTAGFKVTIGTKGRGGKWADRSEYRDRRGRGLPVLSWLEGGTDPRFTRSKMGWPAKAIPRGRLKRTAFMSETLDQVKDHVNDTMQQALRNFIIKNARKHGCE